MEKTVNSREQRLISMPEASSSGSWYHSFPCLCHPCTFQAFPHPGNSITLPSPVPCWNPSKTSPDLITPWFLMMSVSRAECAHLVASHAPTSLSHHRGEGVPASPLQALPLWLGALHRVALKGCLIMPVELYTAGAQCISAGISGASER